MDVVARWLVRHGIYFSVGFISGTLLFTEGEQTRTCLSYGLIPIWGFILITILSTWLSRN